MNFNQAYLTIENMVNGFVAAIPTLFITIVVFMAFYLVARRIRMFVVALTASRPNAKNLGLILGRLAQSAVVVAGALVSLTILFPSFQPGDLIQLLGIGSVAIGFAFRDIFQNFLAGILLLLTSPFRIGDQIVVDDYEGTVEDIQTRATTILTYDGRHIVIPNSDLFNHSVTVNTAFGRRRLEMEVLIDYKDDLEAVRETLLHTVSEVEGVLSEPSPEVLVVGLTTDGVRLRVYWWTKMSRHTTMMYQQDKVLTLLSRALKESGIEFPIMTQQILLRNQEPGNLDERPVLVDQ